MKIVFTYLSFLLLLIINVSYPQGANYKDNLVNDKSLYSGVYEGNLEVSLCCDSYETGFGTIVFYFDGSTLKCLYDGILYNDLSLSKNVFVYTDAYDNGKTFGKFVKGKDEGFLYYFHDDSGDQPNGYASFLKKTGDSEMAAKLYTDAENEFNDFKKFESVFRNIFANKSDKDLLTLINLPFYDKRTSWENPTEYNSVKNAGKLLNIMLQTQLNESAFRYQNANKDFGGVYTILGDKMFFYFKKIGTEFKLVYITNVFG